MKKRFGLLVLFVFSLFALSFTACGSSSSGADELVEHIRSHAPFLFVYRSV